MAGTLKFRKVLRVSQLSENSVVVNFSVNLRGAATAVVWDGVPARRGDRPAEWFRRIFLEPLPELRKFVVFEIGRRVERVPLPTLPSPYVMNLQKFGDSSWLLYESRASSDQANLWILDENFQQKFGFHAGDGIEEVQTADSVGIWVSYFDEGVFGGGIGQAGVARFDVSGTPRFQYNQFAKENNLPFIGDCYAMNVIETETWIYSYPSFFLVRLKQDESLKFWKDIPVRGASAFSMGQGEALFAESSAHEGYVLRFGLDDSSLETLLATDESGEPLPKTNVIGNSWFGRGSKLYFRSFDELYCHDLKDP